VAATCLRSVALALVLLGAARIGVAATTGYPASTFQITVQSATDATEVITFSGPSTIADSLSPGGFAADSGGNGLDDAATEISALAMTGTSTTLGFGLGTMHLVPVPSLGVVEETINYTPGILDVQPYTGTGSVNSFFDVFFELDFSSATLHNNLAAHVATTLSHWQPQSGDSFATQGGGTIELLDPNGAATGYRITSAIYTPGAVPEPALGLLSSWGLAVLAVRARRRA
jgi:hypothetical protein